SPRDRHSRNDIRLRPSVALVAPGGDAVEIWAGTQSDPWNCPRPRVVYPVWDRSFHGRSQDRAVKHPGHLNVDPIGGRSVDLCRQLDAHHILADETEVGSFLELIGLDLRRLGWHLSDSRNVAIAHLAARLSVHDHAWLGGQFFDRNAPLARRIVKQNASHLSADHSQWPVIARHSIRAGRVHHAAEARIA